MALRNRIPDSRAIYDDPIYGVNLGVAQEDVQAGESPSMGNAIFRGGTRTRNGSQRCTATALAPSLRVRGGIKYYYSTASSKRLIAYGQKISVISDAGSETVLTSSLTSDQDVHFVTWPITDKVYASNGTDIIQEYNGTTFQPLSYVGDVDITSGTYKWTVSASGTNEYYLELSGGGDPGLSEPLQIMEGGQAGTAMTKATLGSLSAGEWGWGDSDTLGYSTIYVRVTSGGPDPDTDPSDLYARYSTNIPGYGGNPAAKFVTPVLDRLLCITTNGIERTDARVSNIWSKNSTWATLRPSQVGQLTCMAPFSTRNTSGSYIQGAVAFQPNAHYLITGTDFGDDVTAASASSGEDAAINIMDASVGTSSPYSVVGVAGLGLFWFTSDRNVFWLPYGGQIPGRMVGDRIRSETSVDGIESATLGSLSQVWMIVFDRFLVLGVPVNGNSYATTQFWMDLREFIKNPDLPVWYGPMTGQTVGRAWVENQTGDNAVYAGEGNPTTGVFVYKLMVPNVFKDAVGTSDNNISYAYQTYYKTFGSAGREKYIRSIEMDSNVYDGTVTIDVADIQGGSASGLTVESVT